MASAPPNSVGESIDRTNSDRRSPQSLDGHQSLFGQVGSNEPSFTPDVCSRSSQQDESAANVIMSEVYRRRADELGETRYLSVDDEVQFRSQDGGLPRRSGCRSSTDNIDIEQYDTRAIGQLLSAVGEGAGGIPLSVAELIAERDLRRLRECGYVGPQAVTTGTPSSMFEGPGLTEVNSPVVSIKSSVVSDPKPVLPSSVRAPVNEDNDAPGTTVTTGQRTVYMMGHFGPFWDSFMDASNQRAITTTAGRYSSTAPEVVNRRCGSPELSEDG